jgi:hypothetical protein
MTSDLFVSTDRLQSDLKEEKTGRTKFLLLLGTLLRTRSTLWVPSRDALLVAVLLLIIVPSVNVKDLTSVQSSPVQVVSRGFPNRHVWERTNRSSTARFLQVGQAGGRGRGSASLPRHVRRASDETYLASASSFFFFSSSSWLDKISSITSQPAGQAPSARELRLTLESLTTFLIAGSWGVTGLVGTAVEVDADVAAGGAEEDDGADIVQRGWRQRR